MGCRRKNGNGGDRMGGGAIKSVPDKRDKVLDQTGSDIPFDRFSGSFVDV